MKRKGKFDEAIETEVRLTAGRITDSRSDEPDLWHLRVEDDRTHRMILELRLTPAQFMDLLTHRVGDPVPATVILSEDIGKYAEFDSVLLPRERYSERGEAPPELVKQALITIRGRDAGHPELWHYAGSSANNRSQWVVRFVRYHQTKPEGWRS